MAINQLSVFVENSTGKLVNVIRSLADAQVDIRAMSIADTLDYGILRVIVSDCDRAKAQLERDGFVVSCNKVVGVAVEDKPGALCEIATLLSEHDVNIEYIYAFITVSKKYAYVVLRVEDNEKAERILRDNSVSLVTQEDIIRI